MFKDLGHMLHIIYRKAFPSEIIGNRSPRKAEEEWNRSEKHLFDFLKSYQVCPDLLTKTVVL
jgi:hypothetical protein